MDWLDEICILATAGHANSRTEQRVITFVDRPSSMPSVFLGSRRREARGRQVLSFCFPGRRRHVVAGVMYRRIWADNMPPEYSLGHPR